MRRDIEIRTNRRDFSDACITTPLAVNCQEGLKNQAWLESFSHRLRKGTGSGTGKSRPWVQFEKGKNGSRETHFCAPLPPAAGSHRMPNRAAAPPSEYAQGRFIAQAHKRMPFRSETHFTCMRRCRSTLLCPTPQMEQQVRNIDFDRADLAAGSAQ